MAPENAPAGSAAASKAAPVKRHGREASGLSPDHEIIAAAYVAYLDRSPLQWHSRRTYLSAVRGYLRWLEGADIDGDPLVDDQFRDRAVGEYRTWLWTVAKRSPVTVNKAMAALDSFYVWRGLGNCKIERANAPQRAPRALDTGEIMQYLHSGLALRGARDRAIALMPLYAGTRIAEMADLDIDDVEITAADETAQGTIHLDGNGGSSRSVPIHQNLLPPLVAWHSQRRLLPEADPYALFVSRRGTRMTTDALSDVIRNTSDAAQLDGVTTSVLRHTFESNLIRLGTAPVMIAYLLGRARPENARAKVAPPHAELAKAISALPTVAEPRQPPNPPPEDLADVRAASKARLDAVARVAARKPTDVEWQRDLAASYASLGAIELRIGNLAAARAAYQASFDIIAQLAASDPVNVDRQRDLQTASQYIRDLPAVTS
jgi:site-specific recombinase XerD